jgi:molybdate transport system substrate-binding protein
MSPRFALVLVAMLVVAACSGGASSPSTTGASLTIYGAASLKPALTKLKAAYEAANPGSSLTVSTDSSAALETKIEQGAPVDVFLSADTRNPQQIVDMGLADGTVVKFAGNVLTVIVPLANPASIQGAADLAKPGVRVIAAADSVPITKYASQLVANLAKQPNSAADFAARYAANVATKEDNVAAVVAKIELGEGDAAIVYATDAKASTKVTAIPVPDDVNVPATYGGVVVKATKNTTAARAFLNWVVGSDGQAILASFGFRPAP